MMPVLYLLMATSAFGSLLDGLKDKKLIAIGESGHAVAEFHTQRAIISKKFIEQHGFRNVFIEMNLLAGFKIADAIDSCRNNPDMSEVRKAFGNFDPATYRHNEFYPFYEFMCEWNKIHPKDPVYFYGIDVWSNYWDLRKYLEEKLSGLNINEVTENFLQAKDQCFLWSLNSGNDYATHIDWPYYETYQRVQPERQRNCLSALGKLKTALKTHSSRIPFIERVFLALDAAHSRQQIRDVYGVNFPEAMNLRDAYQARAQLNILKLLKNQSGSILLSHNVHVFKKMSVVLPADSTSDFPWAKVTSAGEWLAATYGERMAVIGMGGYSLKSLRDGSYPIPHSPQSIDYKLHHQGKDTALVEGRTYSGQWWVHNESTSGLWINPVDQFDLYFFIDKSEAATLWKF